MDNVDIERISLNDYVRIVISYSDFFSNVEIGAALSKLFSGTPDDEGAEARAEMAKKHAEEKEQWKKELDLLTKKIDEVSFIIIILNKRNEFASDITVASHPNV